MGCLLASIRLSPRKESFRGDFCVLQGSCTQCTVCPVWAIQPAPVRLTRHCAAMWGARQCGGRYAHHTLAASRFCLASVINRLADSTARTEQPPEAQRVDRGGGPGQPICRQCRTAGETRLQGWAMCILPATALPLPQIAIATAEPFSIPLFQQTDPRPAWCMYSISVWGVGACRSPFGLPYIRTASLQHTPP